MNRDDGCKIGVYITGASGQEMCIYTYEPGDLQVEINGLGIAVLHSNGKTTLVTAGDGPHPCELDALGKLPWQAACV